MYVSCVPFIKFLIGLSSLRLRNMRRHASIDMRCISSDVRNGSPICKALRVPTVKCWMVAEGNQYELLDTD